MLLTAKSFCFFEINAWPLSPKNFTILTQKLKPVEHFQHFVQYLNSIRVGEFNQAMDCLYHYFDRKQWEEGGKSGTNSETSDDAKKDRCKRFCFAALNLAILHTHFGHR